MAIVAFVAASCLAASLAAVSGAEPPEPKLCGIINLPKMEMGLLEVVESGSRPTYVALAAGQREGSTEIETIYPARGVVVVRCNGRVKSVTNLATRLPEQATGIALDNVPLSILLPQLAMMEQRSILRHPATPEVRISLNSQAADAQAAARAIRSALKSKGCETFNDGTRFLVVCSKDNLEFVKTGFDGNRKAQAEPSSEVIPAGMIDFKGTDIPQVLRIYAELKGGKLDDSKALVARSASQHIRFQSATPLNKEECAYALETLLRWTGVNVVTNSDGLLEAVPVN